MILRQEATYPLDPVNSSDLFPPPLALPPSSLPEALVILADFLQAPLLLEMSESSYVCTCNFRKGHNCPFLLVLCPFLFCRTLY
jgi:hypothetical protein